MTPNGNLYRKCYQLLFTALQCLEKRDVLHDVTIASIESLYVILLFTMGEYIFSFDEMVKELWWDYNFKRFPAIWQLYTFQWV